MAGPEPSAVTIQENTAAVSHATAQKRKEKQKKVCTLASLHEAFISEIKIS
jgi:hypothetical protein